MATVTATATATGLQNALIASSAKKVCATLTEHEANTGSADLWLGGSQVRVAVTHGAGLAIVAYGAGLGLGLGLEWCGIRRGVGQARRGVRVRVRVAWHTARGWPGPSSR
eukprot:scaffold105787_cov66-Phaeocystis_antarctica.AAC.3